MLPEWCRAGPRHAAGARSAALFAALVAALLAALLAAGCAQTTAPPAAPRPAAAPPPTAAPSGEAAPGPLYALTHRALANPEGKAVALRLHGQGVQIFRCEGPSDGTGPHWVYRLPQADLSDANGMIVVRHGANLSFEHSDGSRLLGDIVDHVPAPVDNALPWVLIATRSFGKGALAGVTHVQRIDTIGGMPPPGCDGAQRGQVLRVPFSADFVFYR